MDVSGGERVSAKQLSPTGAGQASRCRQRCRTLASSHFRDKFGSIVVRESRCYRPVNLGVAAHSREKESQSLASRPHIPWHSRFLSHSGRGQSAANDSNSENSLNSQARKANRL